MGGRECVGIVEVEDPSLAFGKAIKLRRVELDLSQEELAYRADLARSFVSGVERGAAKATTTSVWKLAVALECKPSDLWISAERMLGGVR
ncbi:MAG: XRE family transcriptional regulator [Thalassolituus maritimus]|nr:MAG: XRE family transcriptional regulator [Thalassolituus maritimus]